MIQRLLILLLLSPSLLSCQNSITGEFSPANDYEFVILYRITPTGKVYTVDTKVNDKGKFKLDLDSEVLEGTYRLVYKLPEEEHFFDFIYNGNESIDFTFSEEKGVTFKTGQNKILSDYLQEMDAVQQEINSKLSSKNQDKKVMDEIFARQEEIQSKAEKASENTYLYPFIKSSRPYIPEDFINKDVYEISRKSDFFDNFDFDNIQLQSSLFPLKIIEDYYHNFVTLKEGSGYQSAINDIHLEIKNTEPNFQKTLLADFWQKLIDENKNNAANYLAQRYLITLADSAEDIELSEKIQLFKNLSLGAKAPNFTLQDYDNSKTLTEIDGSEYYILAFWSTECSHCLKHIPELHQRLKSISSKKIKVIAVGLELEEDAWREKISELPDFIHVLAMDDSLNDLVEKYDIRATPTFVILDKDKKIIAKPRGMKNLNGAIDSLEKYQKS